MVPNGTAPTSVGAANGATQPRKTLEKEPYLDPASGREFQVVKGEVLVRFRSRLTDGEVQRTLSDLGATVIRRPDRLGVCRLRIPPALGVARFIERHRTNISLEVLEPNFVATTLVKATQPTVRSAPRLAAGNPAADRATARFVPNDPLYPSQWALPALEAEAAWAITTGRPEVVVAVLDTGIDATHPDLRNQVLAGYDFVNDDSDPSDDNGHGTHVAGIVAAEGNNQLGVAGIAWGCRVLPVKVVNGEGEGAYSDLAAGIVYAVEHGAKVLNLSVGGYGYSELVAAAVEFAYRQGIVVVAAAGNDGSDAAMFPAVLPYVLAVAAADATGGIWPGSPRDLHVRCQAPGVEILSTASGGGFAVRSGTSCAAAALSGMAALMLSADPAMSADRVDRALSRSSLPRVGEDADGAEHRDRVDAASTPAAPAGGPVSKVLSPLDPSTFAGTNEEAYDRFHVLYANEEGPVHGWIVLQAWKRLPPGSQIRLEMAQYLPTGDGAILYSGEFEADEYATFGTRGWIEGGSNDPDMNSPDTALIEGTWEEDFPGRWFAHFWSPTDGANHGLYILGMIERQPSALITASNRFAHAVGAYGMSPTQRAQAYYWLGRTAHLLADMSSPAHVHLDVHPYDDAYENFTKADEQYKAIEAAKALTDPLWVYTDLHSDLPAGFDADLANLFYTLALKTSEFDSDDDDGNSYTYGRGKYRNGRTALPSDKSVQRIEYCRFPFVGGSPVTLRQLEPFVDYTLVSTAAACRLYYYSAFFNGWMLEPPNDTGVLVWYSDGTSTSVRRTDVEYAGGDIFDDVLREVYQPELQGRAIGYTAALFQLFWERTHRTISGRVTHRDTGAGIAGVTITFSGGGGSTTTGPDGAYTHAVARGWTGAATPAAVSGTFAPSARSYGPVAVNQVAQDYVWTPPIGTRSLAVQSVNPSSGIAVAIVPSDKAGLADGSTPFVRTYNENTAVSVTAPATAQGNAFVKWLRNGLDFSYSQSVSVSMASALTLTAVYTAPSLCCAPSDLRVNGLPGNPTGIPLNPVVLGWAANGCGVFYVYFDEGDVWPTTKIYQGIATSYEVHDLLELKYGCVYSWRVEGKDRNGCVTSSPRGSFTTVGTSPVRPGELVINEFKVEDRSADDLINSQYVELYNNTDRDISLVGLQLAREDWEGYFMTGTIAARSYYTLAGSADVVSHHIASGPVEVWNQDLFFISWGGGDSTHMRIRAGDLIIDEVDYKYGGNGFAYGENGRAYELINPSHSNKDGTHWRLAVDTKNLTYPSSRREYGSPNRENTVFVPCDEQAPVVTIESPTTDAVLRQTVPSVAVTGTAVDSGGNLSRVVYQFNDGPETEVAVTADHWSLPTLTLREGDNSIFVKAYDTCGKWGADGLIVTFYVDREAPRVEIRYPTVADSFTVYSPSILLGGVASDDTGIASLEWRSDNGASGAVAGAMEWTAGPIPLDFGANRISIVAKDPSDNPGFDTLVVVYTNPPPVAPFIARQPQSQAVSAGMAAAFSIEVGGSEPLIYQWFKNRIPIAGATNSSLLLTSVGESDAGDYTVKVTNAAGDITSQNATLTVRFSPVILAQPRDLLAVTAGTASFGVEAAGAGSLSYQWRRNGVALTDSATVSGARGPTLSIVGVETRDAGDFDVMVANAFGSVTSQVARLTVRQDPNAGLLAHYPLDADTFDTSGYGRHGVPSDAPQWVMGPVGSALRLDATYVTIPSLPTDTGSFSMSLWALVETWKKGGNADPQGGEALIWFGEATAGWAGIVVWGSYDTSKSNEVYVGASPGGFQHTHLKTEWFNRWHHLCLTYDAQLERARLYLEGRLLDEGVAQVSIAGATAALGRHWWAAGAESSYRMVGALDDVRVYDRPLAADEVRYLAQTTFINDFRFAPGRFELRVAGPEGQVVQVETSADLIGWSAIGQLTIGSGSDWFTDAVAKDSMRFYRVTAVR